jgi:hypothetical protein
LSNVAQPIEFTERVGAFLTRSHGMVSHTAAPDVHS